MTRTTCCTIALLLISTGLAQAANITNAFPNLPTFGSPINIEDPRDGTDRLFVVERGGQIYVFANNPNVSQMSTFLDISAGLELQGECGLLGLAFHPNYESNRFFYVCYQDDSPFETVIARFTANAANPNLADPGSQVRILRISQASFFHKGGCIAFGPDGYLYISLGEDGTPGHAQNLGTLKGKLLRIDVDNPEGGLQYGIPADNPFEGNPNGWREEIYAFGFRNPWRYSFDSDNGDLWLADVGQNAWEEVDVVLKGRNFGWPHTEGLVCYPQPTQCDTTNLDIVLPVWVYNHGAGGSSITGGTVYRGPSVPTLWGNYIFADYINGLIWALDPDGPASTLLLDTTLNIVSFGTDVDGELYFSTFQGDIYRFIETATDVPAGTPGIGSLRAVHPNPFQANATMDYALAETGRATLEVFDVRGVRVATLVDKTLDAGDYAAEWNGRDANGRVQPSGVYFCRLLVNGSAVGTRRIVLVK